MYKTGDFTDKQLIQLTNDIYDWNNSSDGVVDPDSFLRKFYDQEVVDGYPSMSRFAEDIIREAASRFEKLIKTTMKNCAYMFVAK